LAVFGLMTLFVLLTRGRTLLDPNSFLRHRYAPIPLLMFLHGIPGAIVALPRLLPVFQPDSPAAPATAPRDGPVYVGSVAIAAPVAIAVSIRLPIPTLTIASAIQLPDALPPAPVGSVLNLGGKKQTASTQI